MSSSRSRKLSENRQYHLTQVVITIGSNFLLRNSGGRQDLIQPTYQIRKCNTSGKEHEFHFRTRLFGTGVALDAFEIRGGHPAGYQFQVIGEPEVDLLVLLGRLIEKIRRGLSQRHLKKEKYGVQIADRIVCGRIEWDEAQDGSVPLLNIDGHEVTWRDFGGMLMTFEGWQFKLEIRDKSEEF
jgi:hypothetical protein